MLIRLIPLVSHTHTLAHPEHVAEMSRTHPELLIVQDADKLDALGAIGVARTFLFAGARKRSVNDTFAHFDDKLEKLPETMNTNEGRRIAEIRVRRLQAFREAWEDEARGFDYGEEDEGEGMSGVEQGSVQRSAQGGGWQPGQLVAPQGYGPQTPTPNVDGRLVNGHGQGGSGVGLGVHVAPAPTSARGGGAAPPARMQRMENDPGVQLMEEMYGGGGLR